MIAWALRSAPDCSLKYQQPVSSRGGLPKALADSEANNNLVSSRRRHAKPSVDSASYVNIARNDPDIAQKSYVRIFPGRNKMTPKRRSETSLRLKASTRHALLPYHQRIAESGRAKRSATSTSEALNNIASPQCRAGAQRSQARTKKPCLERQGFKALSFK